MYKTRPLGRIVWKFKAASSSYVFGFVKEKNHPNANWMSCNFFRVTYFSGASFPRAPWWSSVASSMPTRDKMMLKNDGILIYGQAKRQFAVASVARLTWDLEPNEFTHEILSPWSMLPMEPSIRISKAAYWLKKHICCSYCNFLLLSRNQSTF